MSMVKNELKLMTLSKPKRSLTIFYLDLIPMYN